MLGQGYVGGGCVCRIFMIWEEIFIIWSTKLSSRSKVMLSGSHSRLVVEPGGHLDFLTPGKEAAQLRSFVIEVL